MFRGVLGGTGCGVRPEYVDFGLVRLAALEVSLHVRLGSVETVGMADNGGCALYAPLD